MGGRVRRDGEERESKEEKIKKEREEKFLN